MLGRRQRVLFKVERRPQVSLKLRIAAPLIATVATLIVGVLLFSSLSQSPLEVLRLYFIVPLSSINGLSEWLLKASPLILIGCGLAVGFRANVWNIGAEGQLVMGAVAAAGVGLFYPNPDSPFLRSEEHTSELQSRENLVCRLLLEKKKDNTYTTAPTTTRP